MDELLDTINYFYTKAPTESRDVFKQTEHKLIEFTKSDEAWDLGLQALQMCNENEPELTTTQLFFTANTLKTKMIFDFDRFNNTYPDIATKLGNEIIQVIKIVCTKKLLPNVLSSLGLALAIYGVHTNTLPEIDQILGENANEICGLFLIIKYMSEEAMNESLVLHDDIRYQFLRKIKESLIGVLGMLDNWAGKLTLQESPELQALNITELLNIKATICETLNSWLLIDMKEEQFEHFGRNGKDLIFLLFEELTSERQGYLAASNCIAEILFLCRKFKNKELSKFLKENLLLLYNKCERIGEEGDVEAIETYASMYSDLGAGEIDEIIMEEEQKILAINLMFYNANEGKHFKTVNGFLCRFCQHLNQNYKNTDKIGAFKDFFESLIISIIK